MRASLFLLLIALLFSVRPEAQDRRPEQTASAGDPGASTPANAKTAFAGGPGSAALGSAIAGPENERLRQQIQSTLRNEPSLARSPLDVEVTGSQIVLSGSVPTARDKQTARRIAQSYGNNRSVVDSKVSVQSAGVMPAAQGLQRQR
ncbi:MAG: BON domain-containing protein [Candidatus Korobacteraceae bacterium]